MRRNMDLARLILLKLEGYPYTGQPHAIQIDGYPAQEISYHISLLYEAGFIEATKDQSLGSPSQEWEAISITWDGHEFLESSRDETRWAKAKRVLVEKGGPMTLAAVNLVLTELVKKALM